jgi:hypothetical protein
MQDKPQMNELNLKRLQRLSALVVTGWFAAACGLLGSLVAQPLVTTLGGGPSAFNFDSAGYADGSLSGESQFNTPGGLALDSSGLVFIADQENGVIRIADIEQDQVYTFATPPDALVAPVDVAIEELDSGELYVWVADPGSNSIVRFDAFGNVVSRWNGFSQPVSLTFDISGAVLVLQSQGTLTKIQNPTAGTFNIQSLNFPSWNLNLGSASGIVVLNDGRVAVSDSETHVIRLFVLGTGNGSVVVASQVFGQEGLAGFRDGNTLSQPLFNTPAQIAKAGSDLIVVADRLNHRVRILNPASGLVSTLYGMASENWGTFFPGWTDGINTLAEAREPFGVAVGPDGEIYSTERYYHLLRQVTESGLSGPSDGGAGSDTNLVVNVPSFQPNSGYYPEGVEVVVSNPNTNVFLSSRVFYTVDGTEPTINSAEVTQRNAQGDLIIPWMNKELSLSSLKVAASLNGVLSESAQGDVPSRNTIGIKQPIVAGAGSSVIIPVTLDLQPDIQLRSLQFLVEIIPNSRQVAPFGFPDPIPDPFTAVTMQPADFIPIVAATTNAPALSPNTFSQNLPDANGTLSPVVTKQLAVAYLGTNTAFFAENFGVAALISAPTPPNARDGDSYTVRISNPSGTSDGFQNAVTLHALPSVSFTIAKTAYLVGDTAPSVWYNPKPLVGAGAPTSGFGNGLLLNDDVNNAFFASLGVRVPFENTDLYDAMDVFPSDISGVPGGDGVIRFLDWQSTLRRSLGLDPLNWFRFWDNGARVPSQDLSSISLNSGFDGLANQSAIEEGGFYNAHGRLEAEHLEGVQPGSEFKVGVYLDLDAGIELNGLSFRVIANPMGSHLPELGIHFQPAGGIPAPFEAYGNSPSDLLCGWSLNAFPQTLTGRLLLGWIEGIMPLAAANGDDSGYSFQWRIADGALVPLNQAEIETFSGGVWTGGVPGNAVQRVSPEWVAYYFGSENGSAFAENSDPDEDGLSNLKEYLAGTNPLDPNSDLSLSVTQSSGQSGATLSWRTVQGKKYQIETAAPQLGLEGSTWDWVPLSNETVIGDGQVYGVELSVGQNHQYFRLKVIDQ